MILLGQVALVLNNKKKLICTETMYTIVHTVFALTFCLQYTIVLCWDYSPWIGKSPRYSFSGALLVHVDMMAVYLVEEILGSNGLCPPFLLFNQYLMLYRGTLVRAELSNG